ncbi:uroporphyrinogen-III C-methyltransferase [Neorhizobium galegae]|uniref:uroporphyrinogen-III C-methyltransferase n=1 Tax=Neorhizobium galegae TaxID=399 RepID=UPI000621222A|nr:uroporphyrinogen-III C-methyltransferase [Neorhizobium galegae]CDZ29866.1 Probable uroporphyrin-iii c-methyltransferase protein [Neorhizobium galegae bv. officinalis]KAA9385215.1 uroporphyrinogen-III C-methyltransferase [Neorhizobium galegae]KAB1112058.1 uroporphyrinogen-III C-methyltransferase [Neorhizobium galegae]MCM2500432.1 uroporphyrinogen-III C-methyltransferase [Neorhizobium galegae]MCQ1772022.1 uroporphyrinogen-III C-methyltransferase [Neorhizobium galegae]
MNESIESIVAAPVFEPGHVWLAGAGPGHPRYLTLEVADAIGKADVIVHDALVSDGVLSLAKTAELIFVGKRGGKPSVAQNDITGLLIELARKGKRVLRLKGGDPFVFGRGGEEAEALARENIPFRILPGMTSALAALASANIPATMRGMSRAITLATGHAAGSPGDLDWKALAKTGEPIVVYMGVSTIGTIARLLIEGGLSPETPVAVLMAATTPDERSLTATLATVEVEVERQKFAAPALIVIGRIVSMQAVLTGGKP